MKLLRGAEEREKELPSPRELRGMVPDFTGEETTEEYIHRLCE